MKTMSQVVVLQIMRPADATPPSEWDWANVIDEPDVVMLAAGPVLEFDDWEDED
jgi:hypothetical protein